jgi:hypothetical protein
MVIDTSAILAWLKDEPARDRIVAGLEAHPVRRMSSVSLLEAQIVVRGREHPAWRLRAAWGQLRNTNGLPDQLPPTLPSCQWTPLAADGRGSHVKHCFL